MFTRDTPPQAKCSDCGKLYPIPLTADPVVAIDPLRLGNGKQKQKQKRISKPGERHRKDDGPNVLEVLAVPPPSPKELGTAHLYTHEVLQGGERAVIAAHHEAARLSEKFGEEIEAKWCLATPWLYKLSQTHRARARYAMMWRPRFLAVLALTRSVLLASRAAHVSRPTIDKHRSEDKDFDGQVIAAQEQAVELLHDVTMREAIEGHAEPIFWQGIPCGHIIKVDNRLRIEMLRAHMPATFKTPGSKVAISAGNTFIGVTITEKERDELVTLRQEALADMKQAEVLSVT